MLTQKLLKSAVPSNEFSKELIGWLAKDSSKLEASFSKKFPRSKNKFNVQLKNVDGTKRTLVVTSDNEVKLDKRSSYKNFIPWATARRLGCPTC